VEGEEHRVKHCRSSEDVECDHKSRVEVGGIPSYAEEEVGLVNSLNLSCFSLPGTPYYAPISRPLLPSRDGLESSELRLLPRLPLLLEILCL
jgi:hypothetical protein